MQLTIHNHSVDAVWLWVSSSNAYVVRPGVHTLQIIEAPGPVQLSWSMTYTSTPTPYSASLPDGAHVGIQAVSTNSVHLSSWVDETEHLLFWKGFVLPLTFALSIMALRGFRRIALPGNDS